MTDPELTSQPEPAPPATDRLQPAGLWARLAARQAALVEDGSSLWEQLDQRLKRIKARPHLRQDLIVSRQEEGETTYYVIKDPVALGYYRFKENEYFVLTQLNGDHEVRDLVMAYGRRYRPIRPGTVQAFLDRVESFGLLEHGRRNIYSLIKARLASPAVSWLRALLRFQYTVPGTDRLTQRLYRRLPFAFRAPLVLVWVLFAASGLILIGLSWNRFRADLGAILSSGVALAGYALVLYTALVVIGVIHELAHALTCVHYGGHVHNMGLMLYYATVVAYVDTSDAWLFPNRWHRAWVSLAGPLSTLVFAAAGAWAWWLTPAGSAYSYMALTLVLATVPLTFANLNPLLEYDGYYVLSDLTATPNLRRRSFAYCRQWLAHRLRKDGLLPAIPARQRRIFLAYGVLAAVYFLVFLAVPLVLQIQHLLQKHGSLAGGVLAALLLLLFGQRQLRMLYRRWRKREKGR